jgi:hypothetical protein
MTNNSQQSLLIKNISSKEYSLLMIGLYHTLNPNHTQFKEIFNEINKFLPNTILFEFPEEVLELFKKLDKNERVKRFGESGIIYNKLLDLESLKEIKVIPSDIEIKKLVESLTNFSELDKRAYLIIIRLNSLIKRTKESPNELLLNLIKDEKNIEELNYKINEFIQEETGKKISELNEEDYLYPNPKGKNILNKISLETSNMRDKYMIQTIKHSLSIHKKVLFISGISHVERIYPHLKNLN